ncbi:uncharacterized protein LOC108735820 [Agrilus planipennis]|uniref:Uncharacterized protein LOC108735820 n=1 Tax=Agrilus planipennis TaxID=224129 RepID=A0A1W4WSL6_AGRPL|nr:uncharacterized protein LOC108735820 [Agrilus planipennis]
MNIGKILTTTILIIVLISETNARPKKKNRMTYSTVLRQKETNAVNFIRLAVMRLIYGVASRFGFQEPISEALNGAFVPPGVEDDYGDYGDFLDDDDDY